MSKLSKAQTKAHNQACELLKKDVLTLDERFFVLENWHEGATHNNGAAGAFFTPLDMAFDFNLDVYGPRILDLCAGIGTLAFAAWHRHTNGFAGEGKPLEITCIEINPNYVEVGKKILPEATWICGDATDPELIRSLGFFDTAIANPPFGKSTKAENKAPRYTGGKFEYKIIDIAKDLATYGAFIIPQMSAPFNYSGVQYHRDTPNPEHDKFKAQTGIRLDCGAGVDTAFYKNDWKGVSPICEIVTADFEENRKMWDSLIPQEAAPLPSNTEQLALF